MCESLHPFVFLLRKPGLLAPVQIQGPFERIDELTECCCAAPLIERIRQSGARRRPPSRGNADVHRKNDLAQVVLRPLLKWGRWRGDDGVVGNPWLAVYASTGT